MDSTLERYAYRCLPLSIANTHGWELVLPSSFDVIWDGGSGNDSIRIAPVDQGEEVSCQMYEMYSMGGVMAYSRFGSGVLTLETKIIFETPSGYNLWVSGSPNFFKDGVQPLSALVETDWMPYPFTMNWKITCPDHTVRFDAGEPYCSILPVPRGLSERMKPLFRALENDSETKHQYEQAYSKRTFIDMIRKIKGKEWKIENAHKLNFQGWYARGEFPDGQKNYPDHQTKVSVKPFSWEQENTNR